MARANSLPGSGEVWIESLSHEGRGLAHLGGKATFIEGALPGERVRFRYLRRRGRFDEGVAAEVLSPSPERVVPQCRHFGICGGCTLQHLRPEAQLHHKEAVLLEQLRHIGGVEPDRMLEPITGPVWAYRHKARLSVKFVEKQGRLFLGFKEKAGRRVADLSRCEVLHASVGQRLEELKALIGRLSIFRQIPQIEIAVGRAQTALVIRHLAPLSGDDTAQLTRYADEHRVDIYGQGGTPVSLTRVWPQPGAPLSYRLPAQGIDIRFEPTDFTQVNADINRLLVARVLELLDPGAQDRVLDLFCGLGNLSLPLARHTAHVSAVDGNARLIERARENARHNGIENAQFFVADLSRIPPEAPFLHQSFQRVLLDPPRTGAAEIIGCLGFAGVRRAVYVSCNPATLARDARSMVEEKGFELRAVGVLDMFPHTSHIEALALFEPSQKLGQATPVPPSPQ